MLDNDDPAGNLEIIGYNNPPSALGFVLNPVTGEFTFDPLPHFSGVTSFNYTVREQIPSCVPIPMNTNCDSTATATIYLAPVADLPTFTAGSVVGSEDANIPLAMTISLIDTDTSETTEITISNLPTGATLTAGVQQPDDSWILASGSVGSVELVPPADFNGVINVNWDLLTTDTALDEVGDTQTDQVSDGGNFDVTVNSVNDDPVFVGPIPTAVLDEDGTTSVELAGLVTDVDISTNGDFLSYNITSPGDPALFGANLSGSTLNILGAPDAFGSDSVTVEVTDNFGGTPVELVIPVTVNPVNDDPVLTGFVPTLQTDEDVDASVDLAGIASDVDIVTGDNLNYSVVSALFRG